MARKKKEEQPKSSEYDIQIGFVHEFEFFSDSHSHNMNGHPIQGRCYRLIKDPQGYRIHIGRENNEAKLDGLFLGPELKATRKDFRFKIEVVTTDNYLQLPITSEDADNILKWVETESQDLWDKIKLEVSGEVPVIKSLGDLLALLRSSETEEQEELEIINIEDIPTDTNKRIDTSERITASLNYIADKDEEMIYSIADALDYIANCYTTHENIKLKEVILEQTFRFKNKRNNE
jgi:hypothetical protein